MPPGSRRFFLATTKASAVFAARSRDAASISSQASAIRIFGAATPAGTEEVFTAARPGSLIVAAPGGPMPVDGHDTTTPLTVLLQRASIGSLRKFELPDPLADPLIDLRVKSRTAESYFVRAGDYIQIIDVDGRQCTDFQCFSARKVDKGRDLPLDVTTTRTLMGSSYPMPGLPSKYYDQDMRAAGRGGAGYGRPP